MWASPDCTDCVIHGDGVIPMTCVSHAVIPWKRDLIEGVEYFRWSVMRCRAIVGGAFTQTMWSIKAEPSRWHGLRRRRYGLRGWGIEMGGAFFSDDLINKGGVFQITLVDEAELYKWDVEPLWACPFQMMWSIKVEPFRWQASRGGSAEFLWAEPDDLGMTQVLWRWSRYMGAETLVTVKR